MAPLFLVCAFALFQVGFGIYSHATVARLAEEGARHLLFAPKDQAGARAAILSEAAGSAIDPGKLTVSMQTKATPYPHVELTLDYLFEAPGPIPLPQKFPLKSVVLVPIAPE